MAITNADVVTPERLLEKATVTISNGTIVEVGYGRSPAGARILDADGLMLLPGFVDIHSDAIETAIQPRPGGVFPVKIALHELDRTLAAYGITTIFHSLSFCDNLRNDLRNSQRCANLIREINGEAAKLMCHTRIHLRYEITEIDSLALVETLLDDDQVHFFSLMDHTPGQGQFVDENHFRRYYGKVRGKSSEELDRLVAGRKAARLNVTDAPLKYLTRLCRDQGIRVASHDDDTTAKVDWNHLLGVTLSEFPVTLEAAERAHQYGMHVSLGAPNILRGGSATDNLSAREAIAAGFGTIICSDYAPVSMIHAGTALVQSGLADMVKMSRMLSLHPAQAVGIDSFSGSIEKDKAADLVLVDTHNGFPSIKRTFVSGRQVYASC